MHLLFVLLATLCSASLCGGSRILVVIPLNARSHFVVIERLFLALHDRGHHLTVISTFPQQKPLDNLTDIDYSTQCPDRTNTLNLENVRSLMPNLFQTAIYFIQYNVNMCKQQLGEEKTLNLLNEKFDLMIAEFFSCDSFNYIAYKLKIPLIGFVTSTNLPWTSVDAGLPDSPSYIPNFFVKYNSVMSIFQRIFNSVALIYFKVIHHYYSNVPCHELAEKVFGEKLPTINEVNRQASLIFVSSHFSLSQSRPFPPNVVEVGGIHIKDLQPLPEDIKEFLDHAKDGVIMFSFGSLVRISSLPPHVIRAFLDVFATLPQRVILKYEKEMSDVPPNVMCRKWLPQSDILAHPNVRAVIGHGGQASTLEAVHFSKPLVAIPIYGDQFQNANNVASRGAGVLLDIDNLSKREISQALRAVLHDPRYMENMRRLSEHFRDRPMTPLQTAVYWTEYVIRHQGAPHLQPASVHLPLYQYLLLDVIAVLVMSLAVVFIIIYFTVCLIVSVVSESKKNYILKYKKKKVK